MPPRRGAPVVSPAARPAPPALPARKWLLFVHQLPPAPSNLRVRTWRRLQDLGAVALKQAVYVLPDLPATREDFEWLKVDVEGAGGEATVLSGETLESSAEAALVAGFTRARERDYAELAADLRRIARERQPGPGPPEDRRRRDDVTRARQRLAAIERIDFFASPGRERVVAILTEIETRRAAAAGGSKPKAGHSLRTTGGQTSSGPVDPSRYRGRTWVTRPRPGIDRVASAWLIRRFIDPAAQFAFVTDPADAPEAIPFDMYGVAFSHEAGCCTFEVLQQRFAIRDAAVSRLAAIVHDLDLRDDRFSPPEAPTVGAAIDGLQLAHADDGQLLEHGMVLFEALYRGFLKGKGR